MKRMHEMVSRKKNGDEITEIHNAKRKKDPNTHTKKKQIFQENLGRDIKMLKIGK